MLVLLVGVLAPRATNLRIPLNMLHRAVCLAKTDDKPLKRSIHKLHTLWCRKS